MNLKHIPGAVAAIGKLIGASADAGTAWIGILEATAKQRSQKINDSTEAHTALTKAAAQTMAGQLGTDPQLADRAIAHFFGDQFRKQANREAIAAKTVEHLQEKPPEQQATRAPSEDWMNVFGSYAERATSEHMREHWARILDGEIRRPGSFSLVTLQMMSVLDASLAQKILDICPFIVARIIIPETDSIAGAKYWGHLVDLETIGFLKIGIAHSFVTPQDGEVVLAFKRHAVLIDAVPGSQLQIPCATLTQAGQELLSLIEYDDDISAIREVVVLLRRRGYAPLKIFEMLYTSQDTFTFNRNNPIA